jgi:hypothetical protein
MRGTQSAVFAPLLQVPPRFARGTVHGVGSPCLHGVGEPKGGGEKFRLFSNTLRTPLTNAPEMGYNRVQEEKRDVARETA